MPEITPSRYLVTAGWSDVPHLDAATQRELLGSTPRYLRDARSKGVPSLGAGAIWPFPIEDIEVAPFEIPAYWPRCYGLDVGWRYTAAIWLAHDRTNGMWFAYTEHKMGEARPVVHATAIRARGDWIPGLIDPASRGRSQVDGEQLMQNYRDLGLALHPADNAVEAGLWAVEELFGTGRLKIFSTLGRFKAEYMLYRRDEKGKVVKEHDHLCDALRYAVQSGRNHAVARPIARSTPAFAETIDTISGY